MFSNDFGCFSNTLFQTFNFFILTAANIVLSYPTFIFTVKKKKKKKKKVEFLQLFFFFFFLFLLFIFFFLTTSFFFFFIKAVNIDYLFNGNYYPFSFIKIYKYIFFKGNKYSLSYFFKNTFN